MSPLPVRKRLLLLGVLGVLTTISVAAAGLFCLGEIGAINRELAQVNHALHHHQNADMMHDALRADVARAELAGRGDRGTSRAAVAEQTSRHATRFRRSLRAVEQLRLPPAIETSLASLRPVQRTYIATAEQVVASALRGRGPTPAAEASYQAAYHNLVPTQARVTQHLVSTSTRLERVAQEEKAEAQSMITTATAVAVAGWVALIGWHHRSLGRLRWALAREAEHRSAADLLQQSLLPARLPTVPGMHLVARSVPGSSRQRVGGDWYDALTLPSGRVCLVVGDVVGHDLPAATAMGQLRNTLRAYALEDESPGRILARLNRAAFLLDAADLATCICAVVDPATRDVSWATAGHLPPLLSSPVNSGRMLRGDPGAPLGVDLDAEYSVHGVTLEPGETLLLYTDGLVERRGKPIDVGMRELQRMPMAHPDAEAICDHLLATVASSGSAPEDDVTMLLAQATPGDGETAWRAEAAASASAAPPAVRVPGVPRA